MSKEKCVDSCLVATSVVLLAMSLGIPGRSSGVGSSPGTIPCLASLVMLAFSISYLVLNGSSTNAVCISGNSVMRILAAIGSVVLYIAILETVGYMVSTAILVLSVSFLCGYANTGKRVVSAVILSTLFWIAFSKLFSAYLPDGWIA